MTSYILQIDLRPNPDERDTAAYHRRTCRNIQLGLDAYPDGSHGVPAGVTVQLLIDAGTVRSWSLPLILEQLPALDYQIVADSAHTARRWAQATRERVPA